MLHCMHTIREFLLEKSSPGFKDSPGKAASEKADRQAVDNHTHMHGLFINLHSYRVVVKSVY